MYNVYVPSDDQNKSLIKLLNKVFRKNFPTLLPTLYGKDKCTAKYHYCIDLDGKRVGAVCAYPSEIKVGEVAINGLGIGMVATKKSARGKGVMTTLLNHALTNAEKEYDIAYLTGRRKRYEHFGFYPAGCNHMYEISNISIQKYKKGNPYKIIRVKSKAQMAMVNALSAKGYQVINRPLATDAEVLLNWHNKLYLVEKQGTPVGFISAKLIKLDRIFIDGGSQDDYAYAVSAFMQFKKLKFIMAEAIPSEAECIKALDDVSETKSIREGFKFKVFNYARLFNKLSLLAVQEGYKGEFCKTIEIEGVEKFTLSIRNGIVNVTSTEEEAELILTEQQAVEVLLGPSARDIPLAKFGLHHSDLI